MRIVVALVKDGSVLGFYAGDDKPVSQDERCTYSTYQAAAKDAGLANETWDLCPGEQFVPAYSMDGHAGISTWNVWPCEAPARDEYEGLPEASLHWFHASETPCIDGDDLFIAMNDRYFWCTFDGYCSKYRREDRTREQVLELVCTMNGGEDEDWADRLLVQ